MSQIKDGSSSSYVTAPSSPSGWNLNNMHYFFYSVSSSPITRIGYELETQKTNEHFNSDLDEFEFDQTSGRFCSGSELEISQKFEVPTDDERENGRGNQMQRGDSFSPIAFADELFSNGQLLPLKLPPGRLISYGQGSNSTSPRSPSSVIRIPFARKNVWNDDFDPFAVALDKVREEKTQRNISVHRRSTSQPILQQVGPKPNELVEVEPKIRPESMRYKSTTHVGSIPQSPTEPSGFSFKLRRRRGKSVKVGQEEPIKPTLTNPPPRPTNAEESDKGGTRMQKMKGLLTRYASFGRDFNHNKQAKQIEVSYFKRLSFQFKGIGKKKGSGESKMAVVEYRPKLTICLGYGMKSPKEFI